MLCVENLLGVLTQSTAPAEKLRLPKMTGKKAVTFDTKVPGCPKIQAFKNTQVLSKNTT
jgi:hypothetical protein